MMVATFLKYQPDLWKRMPARLGKEPETTSWMISQGMNVNQTDWLGVHALHYGCSLEELQVWNELGVEFDIVDAEHLSTPLGWAARRGDHTLAKALLDKGADPHLAGADWARPVEWARRRGHTAIVELLHGR